MENAIGRKLIFLRSLDTRGLKFVKIGLKSLKICPILRVCHKENPLWADFAQNGRDLF